MGLMKHHRAALEQRLDDAQRQFVDASMRVAAAEARADERGSDRADLQAQNAGLRDRQAHLETENTRLTWSLGEAGRNLAATQALVAAIGQTRAWRTAQVWYAFKRAVWRFLTGGANPS
jgi:chromosome segregation ATPase